MRRGRWLAGVLGLVLAASVVSGTSAGAAGDHLTGAYARQAAGQRVVYSYPGLTPPAGLLGRIRAGEAAGVIFFGENVSSLTQIRGVVQQLRAAAAQSPMPQPLLLMTDQEGGQIRRLPGEPALSHKDVGQSADPGAAATNAGRGAGQNLAGVGMNVNLAPVLDVFHASGDLMDQYERSFSSTATVVGDLGANYVAAQQAAGCRRDRQALPWAGQGERGRQHRQPAGDAVRPADHPARGRRGALPGRDRRRREARHAVVGGLLGARPEPAGRAVLDRDRPGTA